MSATTTPPPHAATSGPRAGAQQARRVAALGGILVVAIDVVFLGQLVRRLFPSVGWYLRDTVGLGPVELLPYALGPFLLAAAAPLVLRILRPRAAFVASGVGLAVARLVEQASTSPRVDLWASAAGVVFALWVLALAATRSRRAVVSGIVLGLGADTALKGAAGTLELSWAPGPWPDVAVGVLAVVLVVLAAASAGRLEGRLGRFAWLGLPGGHTPRSGFALIAIGPLLLLHWLVLHNQGWLSTLTGWSWPSALAAIVVADLVALVLAQAVLPRESNGAVAALCGLVLLGAASTAHLGEATFGLLSLAAVAATGPYLASVVAIPDPTRPAGAPTGVWLGVGHVGLAAAALVYYLSLELPLPIGMNEIRAGLGIGVAIVALAAVDIPATPSRFNLGPVALGLLLLLAPIAVDVTTVAPEPVDEPQGAWPLTVATYNLHGGYAVDGRPSLPEIAEVLEGTGAEVIGLQEADRGWLLNGSSDAVGWLARRLDMPYVAFHATTEDPLWGNAVLSKHPFVGISDGFLPRLGTYIRRGYVLTELDLAGDDDAHFLVTHLHHEAEDLTTVHNAQIDTILNAWDERERTILVGDLNAEPDSTQMQRLIGAGFRDAWADAGDGAGLTWRADDPHQRIDWILVSEDLEVGSVQVVPTAVSDHRPVVARVDVRAQ